MSDIALRASVNLGDAYDGWLFDEKIARLGRLRWRTVNDRDYLYRMFPGSDNGSSLGVRSAVTEAIYDEGREAELRLKGGKGRLRMLAAQSRAAKNPVLPAFAGSVLRELDVAGERKTPPAKAAFVFG